MQLVAPKVSVNGTSEQGSAVGNGVGSTPATATLSASRPGYHNDLTQKLANMDMNSSIKHDLRNDDFKELQELGQGNGGSVKKVLHVPSSTIMAKKVRVRQ